MKLRYLVSLAILALISLSSCADRDVSKPVRYYYRMKPFCEVQSDLVSEISFRQGNSYSVELMGDSVYLSNVRMYVRDNKLVLTYSLKTNLLGKIDDGEEGSHIIITSPDLIGVELNGVGDFYVHSLDTDTLNMFNKGVGDVTLDSVVCDRLNLTLLGTGDANVKKLVTKEASVTLKGVGDIKVAFLQCQEAWARLVGTGDITLTGRLGKFHQKVAGTGDLNVEGLRIGY